MPIGKLSTATIREWRAELLGNGVSVSMVAKAYSLLRAVLMTATDGDKILPANPCRILRAGDEDAAERPVLTVAQVFALSERVGRRPVGNIRALPGGGYRLRFRRFDLTVTVPLPGHLPFCSACQLDANCWCRRLARVPGTVLALPQIWVSARWISCLGPASIERQVAGTGSARDTHADLYET